MKKRLEAELISIAHRILKLKNKSEVDQLYKETQKLYETLSVLKFYQDNFESVKSDVAEDVLEEKLEQSNQAIVEPALVAEVKEEVIEPVAATATEVEEETEEVIVSEEPEESVEEDPNESEQATQLEEEPSLTEDSNEIEQEETAEEEVIAEEKPSFEPIFGLEEEEEMEPVSEHKPEEKLEDHIGRYEDPVFVKPNEVTLFPTATTTEIPAAIPPVEVTKTAAMSDAMSKSIAIGLNDRIGFVQHLFNDSNEDFNRVISQLNTFDTFEEAKTFINEMVIPDYGYWVGAEDYMERFMAIVEKKFQ